MVHTLAPAAHAAMLRAAEAAAPFEACGLLLGTGTHIHTAVAATNVHPHSATRFEIDPAALIAAHRAARTGGPALLGYWHSHPNGLAGPSDTDRAAAAGDGLRDPLRTGLMQTGDVPIPNHLKQKRQRPR